MSTAHPHVTTTGAVARAPGRGEQPEAGPARFIADPAGLGLAAFALSTIVVAH
jgi:succinate-acetate transporter protein